MTGWGPETYARTATRITCATCVHFVPGALNPTAGMGHCAIGRGYFHPMMPHTCRDHETAAEHDARQLAATGGGANRYQRSHREPVAGCPQPEKTQ